MKATQQTNFRLPKPLLKRLRKEAQRVKTTVTQIVVTAITRHLTLKP